MVNNNQTLYRKEIFNTISLYFILIQKIIFIMCKDLWVFQFNNIKRR